MTLKTIAVASFISLTVAITAFAAPVDFNFSFSNGTSTITGLIQGLDSDGLGQAASSITVVGLLDTYVFTGADIFFNSFDVSGATIDTATVDFTAGNLTPSLRLFGASPFIDYALFEPAGTGPTTPLITRSTTITYIPMAAVPLPSGGLLLLTGLGGVAALKRRKKRA